MNIITLTLNPALDVHLSCEALTLGEYNKVCPVSRDCGGKGVNLSRALCVNSVDNTCIVVLGKEDADKFILPLYNIGMRVECILADGRVRENINIHHADRETVIATDGPAVGAKELCALRDKLLSMVSEGDIVALCGSLSAGTDKEAVLALLYELKRMGARLVIDSKSVTAEELLSLKPYLIKPNEEEAELLTGIRPKSLADAANIAAAIRDSGCEQVMLTMGGMGTIIVLSREFPWTGKPGRLQSMELQRVRHD